MVAYGFWIFLLSDFILFSGFFAGYAVLSGATAGGPSGSELFELPLVAVETALLLLSSFTCGLAGIALTVRNMRWFQSTMAATFVLGAGFLALEAYEFTHLIGEGAGPGRSAFPVCLLRLGRLPRIACPAGSRLVDDDDGPGRRKGFRDDIERRVQCFALFWHALDIIWVAVFTMVYLLGSGT